MSHIHRAGSDSAEALIINLCTQVSPLTDCVPELESENNLTILVIKFFLDLGVSQQEHVTSIVF